MFRPSTALAALAALPLAGCWPVIPGQWSDYDVPSEALIIGGMQYYVPLGDYWNDTTPYGVASWGVFSAPQTVNGADSFGVPGECRRNHSPPEGLSAALRTDGSGTSRWIHNGVETRLPWTGAGFSAEIAPVDFQPDVPYDLAPLEFADLGTIEIPEFLVTPPDDFVVTSHAFAAASPPVVAGPQDLSFTWTGTKADYVMFSLLATDGEVALEQITCLAEDTGAFTVPAELFQNTSQTAYLITSIGPLLIGGGHTEVAGVTQGYVTSAAWLGQGAITYGAP